MSNSNTAPRPVQGTRVVVTGIGAVSPNGIGREAFWKATREGKSGIRRIEAMVEERQTRLGGRRYAFIEAMTPRPGVELHDQTRRQAAAEGYVTAVYNFGLSSGMDVMGAEGLIFTIVIFFVALGLWLYSKAMQGRGVLGQGSTVPPGLSV